MSKIEIPEFKTYEEEAEFLPYAAFTRAGERRLGPCRSEI